MRMKAVTCEPTDSTLVAIAATCEPIVCRFVTTTADAAIKATKPPPNHLTFLATADRAFLFSGPLARLFSAVAIPVGSRSPVKPGELDTLRVVLLLRQKITELSY